MRQLDSVLSPSDFVALVNQSIEYALPYVVLEGELSELKVRRDRWLYLKVKDQESVVDCFGSAQLLPGPVEVGMMVRLAGRPKLHPQFGFNFQFSSLELVGQGSINRAQQLLYGQLAKEGLFSESRKRQLPYPPSKVALITSAEGAAIGDFIKIVESRWPYLEIDVYDTIVQGESAVSELCQSLATTNQADYEAVVIIRGGGSLEDLAVFNHERVVRAIASSRHPTVVAIGHQTDEPLAELVADRRASTPSNAAEILVPERLSVISQIQQFEQLLSSQLDRLVSRMDEFATSTKTGLRGSIEAVLKHENQQLQLMMSKLMLFNPEQILKRGYSLVKHDGQVVKRSKQLKSGDKLELVFFDGSKMVRVE